MDETASRTIELISANNSEQIAKMSETIGIAAVSRAHEWAKVHSQYGLTTDIKWWKGKEVCWEALRQPHQIEELRTAIEQTSDAKVEQIKMPGRMVGLDVETDIFHFKPQEGGDIRGHLSDELKTGGSWEIPANYDVELIQSSKLHYSTGEQDVDWQLVAIEKK